VSVGADRDNRRVSTDTSDRGQDAAVQPHGDFIQSAQQWVELVDDPDERAALQEWLNWTPAKKGPDNEGWDWWREQYR
jgi:hypothetical protein